jgi:hypothetical protein
MSAKESERHRKELDDLRDALKEAQDDAAAHLRNIERLTIKAMRTDDAEAALSKAHANRNAGWSRAGALEVEVTNRDLENVKLAKELEAAVAAQGTMPADIRALRQVAVDFIVEARTGGTTAGIMWARRLETEMVDAGFPVAAEVEIRTRLGGAS